MSGENYVPQIEDDNMAKEVEMLMIPLSHKPDGPFRASEGSAIELTDGRILYAYSHLTHGCHDHDVADIRGIVSKNTEGTEWGEPFIIKKNDSRLTTMIASLVRLGKESMTALKSIQGKATHDYFEGTEGGGLGLVYHKTEGHYRDAEYFRLSRDDGESWSEDVRINEVGNYAAYNPNNDSVIVLRNGRIIVPVAAGMGSANCGFVFYSDDEGVSWRRSNGEVDVPVKVNQQTYASSAFDEPNVVELTDGRIMMFGRTLTGRIWKSYSEDFGLTWSEAEPTELASSASPVSIGRIPSTGDLLLIWNQVTAEETAIGWGRMRMSCAVSKDDGETWEHFKNLESLDDVTRVDSPVIGESYDVMSGINAIATRRCEVTERKPPDPDKYPHAAEGHWHVDYPSLCFTRDNRAVITYGVYGGPDSISIEQCGTKLRILPVEWFYS